MNNKKTEQKQNKKALSQLVAHYTWLAAPSEWRSRAAASGTQQP